MDFWIFPDLCLLDIFVFIYGARFNFIINKILSKQMKTFFTVSVLAAIALAADVKDDIEDFIEDIQRAIEEVAEDPDAVLDEISRDA